ncbi:MAG: translation initiation factor IF-2 N-terminal domain-containing protein [Ignavibacteriaceae bacterium]
MSETKAPKIRLYKYAAEINLSSENLIEFLRNKGYEIKSHQSTLTEDMINEINAHFK